MIIYKKMRIVDGILAEITVQYLRLLAGEATFQAHNEIVWQ